MVVNNNMDVATAKHRFSANKSVPMPLHLESAQNLLFGKPKPDHLPCRHVLVFDPKEFEESDPYSSEVLTRENTLALITFIRLTRLKNFLDNYNKIFL